MSTLSVRHPPTSHPRPVYLSPGRQVRSGQFVTTFFWTPNLHPNCLAPLVSPHPGSIPTPTLPSITSIDCPPFSSRIIPAAPPTPGTSNNRISSMRSMPENSVGGSRASSMSSDGRGVNHRDQGERDEFMAHQTRTTRRRKGKAIDEEDAEGDTSTRSDKRRRTTRASNAAPAGDASNGGSASPEEEAPAGRGAKRTKGGPPALKPMGFAASREAKRESKQSNPEAISGGGRPIDFDRPLPSPVVMGFDFKGVDDEQMKTVRQTIRMKEQQEALIAARQLKDAASTPNTPKELSFKPWQPKDPEKPAGVGRRREKGREKVEKMTIETGAIDKDNHPGSKSAPLGASFSSQQHNGREYPPSGSQTALPPNAGPPMGYPPNSMDMRTAPIGHARSGREDQELARRGMAAGGYPNHPQYRRFDPSQSGRVGEAYQRGHAMPIASGVGSHGHNDYAPPGTNSASASPPHANHGRRESGTHRSHRGSLGGNEAILAGAPPTAMMPLGAPPPAGYPYNALMENLQQAEALKFTLQDLLHRYESAYATGASRLAEFKAHNNSASNLLATLQQSADSLREMVRYEVHKSNNGDKKELEEMRERIKALEAKLGITPNGSATAAEVVAEGSDKPAAKAAETAAKKKRTPKTGKKKEKAKDTMEVDGDQEEDELEED